MSSAFGFPPFKPRDIVGHIAPYEWPQDKAQIPAGMGIMPRVELTNQYMVKQEGYVYSGSILNVTYGAAASVLIIPTEPDGDFWCDTVSLQLFEAGTTNVVETSPQIQIEDIRTNWQMFTPYGRTLLFADDYETTNHYSGEFIQNVVFTRHGGIKVTLTNDCYNSAALDAYFIFSGWKEYQYASR